MSFRERTTQCFFYKEYIIYKINVDNAVFEQWSWWRIHSKLQAGWYGLIVRYRLMHLFTSKMALTWRIFTISYCCLLIADLSNQKEGKCAQQNKYWGKNPSLGFAFCYIQFTPVPLGVDGWCRGLGQFCFLFVCFVFGRVRVVEVVATV